MSNPLNLVTDPEIKQMRIESLTVFPRTINDGETTGAASFVLPSRGYLSSDSRIVLPAKCADPAYQYPPNVGVFSLISTATLSTASSGVLAQIDNNAGELYVRHQRRSNYWVVLQGNLMMAPKQIEAIYRCNSVFRKR